MRYLLLICTDESTDQAMGPDEASARMARYGVGLFSATAVL